MKPKTAVAAAYLAVGAWPMAARYRRWHLRWGAQEEELAAQLPGDDMCAHPNFDFTRAVTIRARPEEIWPWLVQIGFGRAGWYSYDLLDNRGRHSAEQVIPELQQLDVGDWVPMDFTGHPPTETTAMRIRAFQPNEWLLWEHRGGSWVWVLRQIDEDSTRLITRGRQRYSWTSPMMLPMELVLMEIGDFPMMRKLLLNVKRRAETLAAQRTGDVSRVPGRDVVVENTVQIARPPGEAFDYCVDMTHELEWNPRLKRVEKLTDDPLGVGTRYRAQFERGDPMVVEVVRFERPTTWATHGESRGLTANFEGRVRPAPGGTQVTFHMQLVSRGPTRWLAPLLRRYMYRAEERNLAAIKATLEAAAQDGA